MVHYFVLFSAMLVPSLSLYWFSLYLYCIPLYVYCMYCTTVFALYLYYICTIFTIGVLSPCHCWVLELPVCLLVHQSNSPTARIIRRGGDQADSFRKSLKQAHQELGSNFFNMKISCRSESSNISLVVLDQGRFLKG